MKKLILCIFAISAFVLSASTANATYVRGHYRSDGTYVQPHYRSNPDGNPNNNYSHKGNVNPYTGKRGTQRWKEKHADTWAPSGAFILHHLTKYRFYWCKKRTSKGILQPIAFFIAKHSSNLNSEFPFILVTNVWYLIPVSSDNLIIFHPSRASSTFKFLYIRSPPFL